MELTVNGGGPAGAGEAERLEREDAGIGTVSRCTLRRSAVGCSMETDSPSGREGVVEAERWLAAAEAEM